MRPKRRFSQLHLRLDGSGNPGFISPMNHPFAPVSGQTAWPAMVVRVPG